MRRAGSKNEVRDASKLIKKQMLAVAKAKKTARITRALADFKDLQRIADIRGNGKQLRIGSASDKDGVERTDRHDIAEVFAVCLETLYKRDGEASQANLSLQFEFEGILAITREEIRGQLKRLKPRKAADGGGIVAELLCKGSDMLIGLVVDISLQC